MPKRFTIFLLGCIFLLGTLLRFSELSQYPNGFHRDEAFFGYNAFAIYQTGKDMTGNTLPFHLASFLYTPSGYSYVSIPFIALFGLNEFSVRAASAFFGSLTVLVTYFLCVELLGFLKRKETEAIALVTSLLLVISPWHINLSRTASAIAVVVFSITLGVYLYLIALRKKNYWFLVLSFLSWFLSLGFYIAPYSFLPLFIPLFLFLFWKDVFVQKTKWLQIVLFVILIITPLLITLHSPQLSLRANSLSITKWEGIQTSLIEEIHAEGTTPPFVTRLFHNKVFAISQAAITNYFHHLSFDFLFTDAGFPDRYRVPLVGLVYLYELPLLLIGLWTLLRWKRKEGYLILGWILLAPIGSSLTYDDVPNLQRTLFMLPGLTIAIGIGMITLLEWIKGIQKKIALTALSLVMVASVIFYLHQYYVHATIYRPWYRQDGYKTLVAEVTALQNKYKKVVVTNQESAPTIFFLFYTKYNPAIFQKETAHTTMHDFDRIGFGSYSFSQEECPLQEKVSADGIKILTGAKGVLYVDSGLCTVPKNVRVLDTIYRSDNSKVFLLLDIP